jgi:gas vesicle protein
MRAAFLATVALGLLILTPAPGPARSGRDPRTILDKLKELKEELERAKEAYDYVTGVAEDIRNKRPPRKPKSSKLKYIDERLSQQLRDIRDVKIPSAIDGKSPQYEPSDAELKAGDPASRRKVAAKMLAYNKALRDQVTAIEAIGQELAATAERADLMHKAGSRLKDKLGDLQDTAAVRAAFRDTFGMVWLDLEAKILPTLSDIRSEAERKAREFKDEGEKRRKALATHTRNSKDILQGWKLSVPPDLRD